MSERETLYFMNGAGNYWVVSRAGYDLAAFTTKDEAQAEYDRLVAAERRAAKQRDAEQSTREGK